MFDVSKKGGLRFTSSVLRCFEPVGCADGIHLVTTWSLTKILAWKLCEAVILVWLDSDGSGIGFVGE